MSEENKDYQEEDLLDQGKEDLLNKASNNDELLTEVTSIAKEKEKGADIEVPDPQVIIQRASVNFYPALQATIAMFKKLSGRGKDRVMQAILDLPTDKVPVKLRSDEEKAAFAYGQRSLSYRFLITQQHIIEQSKLKAEAIKKASEEKGENDEQSEQQ